LFIRLPRLASQMMAQGDKNADHKLTPENSTRSPRHGSICSTQIGLAACRRRVFAAFDRLSPPPQLAGGRRGGGGGRGIASATNSLGILTVADANRDTVLTRRRV